MMWHSFQPLSRDGSTNSQKRLEWRVLQAGCPPTLPQALCQWANLPRSSCSRTEPWAGLSSHLASSIPRKQSWEIPPACPRPGACMSCLCSRARDKRVGSRYRTPEVKGFRSHWQIILRADATGLFSDWAAHKVSVSRSDPKNRLLDASRGGWVRCCHTPHGPAPTDLARTWCAKAGRRRCYPHSAGEEAEAWLAWSDIMASCLLTQSFLSPTGPTTEIKSIPAGCLV
ncbi:uncharacterized protein LOC125961093 isoform X1 [Orcinus orca]|uniref:uncharacterized protein LOC125961093 isoform X1 n=1 Tax=Orcinus orca TaxID=9733 RepID=UPI002111F83C|nr:uncharacterized protein LOC125961093 isoform X1 [Orcinus orca]